MKRSFITLLVVTIVLVYTGATAQTNRISNNARSRVISTQGQLQGAILFADNNVLQQLQQEWGANIAQAAGNQIKVELWRVNYVPDKSNSNYTDVLLAQKLDANVSYQPGQNNIGYSISYRPVAGNVAIIAYSVMPRQRGNFRNARTLSNSNANIKINGKPNDGTPASMTHQFKSDAKKYLGDNIIYGIYSLPQRADVLNNANFRVGLPPDPNCKNCDWVSDAWNAVTDVANDVANTASDVANSVGNLVKTTADGTVTALNGALKDVGESIIANSATFIVQAFGTIATFVQNGDLPQARMLSDNYYGNAYTIANSTIFMGTLPPANKIIVTNMVSINERMFTLPVKVGNDVFVLMNMGKGFDDPLNYNRNGEPGDVFIHELTHAWQIWHIDVLKLVQDGAVNQFRNTIISNQYHYDCDGHNMTDSYNEEQQAMIVENFYSELFFRPDLFGKASTSVPCGFEQQWVVQNILGNQPANINAQFTATGQMIYLSWDKTTAANTGGLPGHTLAVPSNGNRTDGTGYYLQGKINNSFFYYSNKTRTVSANWGPVRDKYIKENYEFGELGWPEANEGILRDGAGFFQKFDHGYIYWHPKYGAHAVLNKINDAWKAIGSEAGALGYPISDYFSEVSPQQSNNRVSEYADKGYQKFTGGVIFYARPTSPALLVNRGDQNYATIEYGEPDRIIAMHTINTKPRRAEEVTATQQSAPGGAKPSPGSTVQRRADAVELNPQPLPPKNKGAVSKKPLSTKVELNPQPLPPKN